MATSFKSLTQEGTLKRADAYKVRYTDIVVADGFNTRDNNPRLEAHINDLFEFIMSGGKVPALEVQPHAEGGAVVIVDGHCRFAAYGRAIDAGAPIEWVDVIQFVGNNIDRAARIVSSNNGLKLTQLEMAKVYKRLAGFGLTPQEIAVMPGVGKSRQHVDQLLILANANADVQRLVADETVPAAVAIEAVRRHGDQAGLILEGRVETAAAKGKKKVTAWKPSAKLLAPVLESVEVIANEISQDAYLDLKNAKMFNPKEFAAQYFSFTVPAVFALDLIDQLAAIEEARCKH